MYAGISANTASPNSASLPVIATLADLGDYLDPDGEFWPADECHVDPAHHPGCSFFVSPAAT